MYDQIQISGGDTAAPLNLEKRLALIGRFVTPGASILDCGCGKGDYVVGLRRQYGVDARGIEYLESKVDAFQTAYPGADWVTRGDLEHIDYPDNRFDVALLNEVLEHVPNDDVALREVYRVLKPGGRAIIFSPNRLYPFESHGVYLHGSDRKIPPFTPLIPYVPTAIGAKFFRYWARNYWPWELQRLVEQAGFTIAYRSFVWQTFEGISKSQLGLIQRTRSGLRRLANTLERTPVVRAFGISQLIVAQK